MKRILSILVIGLMVVSFVPAAYVMAEISGADRHDVEGKVRALDPGTDLDPGGEVITLEDGTRLMVPVSVRVQRGALKEGTTVRASYEEWGGEKIVTSIEVR